ncbi:hypothetical protein [Mycobacterium marinum]|uniref:hypothetical protein n=1 Tax=Mycobacterium marinum TaxID=1781 RepID=UPI000E3C54C0|nr:hypothetical protein [Mycobacterium marinum]QQW36518.1 hypothetical protein HXW97_23825 [Mycobacterium marinum]
MAVKVTLKNGDIESFDAENDEYWERHDGFLEVHRGEGIVKIFAKGYWVAVEGKQKPDELLGLA